MKIQQLTINTRNFAEMKQFYDEKLGLPVAEEQPDRVTIQAGGSQLILQKAAAPGEQSMYHIAFTIPTNQLGAAKKWAAQRGIRLFRDQDGDQFHFKNWNADALYFYDPDENLIEFIAHHSFDNAEDEDFTSSQLLRISEIGLPVDDVGAAVERIQTTLGLSMWSGDGRQFAAMGDAEGLLIVVDRDRPWFPDGRAPMVSGARIVIQGQATEKLLLQADQYDIQSQHK
ncbi:catechol-2,3-dioxygenase [Paenibacillus rhizosphaerae]|uniref:Catechol-2,3-dioxygenase n=1 Tax=Paenibacillus rhizosphaerae TaxID=297318 RepID=A0A839TIJ1_9BACL|nr:VOC family protein [Paenibacillus rhizosphaerae]MBB3126481.1 catechol-2,3-dioxygenase [Paenibacillus rhizosphaerae]